MRVLVIHQNFPGQFAHIVRAWHQRPGWDVRALGHEAAPGLSAFNGLHRYRLAREQTPKQHPYLIRMERALLHGQAAARVMLAMKAEGFVPDVVIGHPGWGETLFVKDVFPSARLVHLCEWYYASHGADVGFDPEFPATIDDHARLRAWNALHALNLTMCDLGIAPTRWQLDQHPREFHHKMVVQHEGIDLARLGPDANASITMPTGVVLRAGDPVITYVSRNLEPYRGFHVFMRSLERIQRRNPKVHTIVIGANGVSYGRVPKDAEGWREKLEEEVSLDPARTHFMGRVSHELYARALKVSAVHIYLTYPFVLSWSMLEAMACGAVVLGSQTKPVLEVVEDGVNGFTTPFFDVDALVNRACSIVDGVQDYSRIRANAIETAKQYSYHAGVAGYERILRSAWASHCDSGGE